MSEPDAPEPAQPKPRAPAAPVNPVIEAMAREFFEQLSMISGRASNLAVQVQIQKRRIADLESHIAKLEAAMEKSAAADESARMPLN